MRRAAAIVAILIAGGCYRIPVWSGNVDVTPRERAAIATCGNGALTDAGARTISREPYLQSTTTSSTTVVWGTRSPNGRVVLTEPGGPEVASVEAVYAGDPQRRAARLEAMRREGKPVAAEDIYVVKATLGGLEPTHLYCYQLFAGDIALTAPAPLATASAPHPTDHVRFVAVGDTGTGGAAQRAISTWISAQPFELMVFLGDVAYRSGTAAQLRDNFFTVYRNFLRFVPAYPVIGNHERRTRSGQPYFEAFVLPEPERYYSFDWGNVHFVAIDTTQRDATQLAWLDEDLRRNKLPWVIVFGHHPMYSNGFRGPKLDVRRAFAKVLTDHQVDIVLAGHEHHYERFRVAGVNYIVSGGGGAQLTRLFGESRAISQFTVHHFLSFDVTAQKLTMQVIDIRGRELEKLVLTKKAEPRPVEPRPVEPPAPVPPDEQPPSTTSQLTPPGT